MKDNERLTLALWARDYTLKNGADDVAVSITNQRDVEIEYRDKQLDKIKESTRNSLSLRIYADKRYSGHSTNDLRRDSLKKFIDEAIAATRYLTEDEFRVLPDPKYYPTNLKRDLAIRDDAYESFNSEKRVAFASEVEKAANAVSEKIISTTSGYSDTRTESVRVHSNGFQGGTYSTYFSSGAEVTVDDSRGGRPSDWYWGSARFLGDMPDPETLGKEAAKRALEKIGQKKIESGTFPMIVENRAARRLLPTITTAMNGWALQQKRSFLDGKLGTAIASERLTLIDDPLMKKGLASRLYDGEGLEAKKRLMIDKGILKEFYIDTYYGKKLGMEPNGGSSSNLLFAEGEKSLEEMVRDIDRGILVNGFIGGNSNSTTGDFSFGIVGFLIENGEPVQPVNEMNISGNALDLWKQLAAVGNDPYPYSSYRMPSMLFDMVEFSGV